MLNEFRQFFELPKHKPSRTSTKSQKYPMHCVIFMKTLHAGLICEGDGCCLDPGTMGLNGQALSVMQWLLSALIAFIQL